MLGQLMKVLNRRVRVDSDQGSQRGRSYQVFRALDLSNEPFNLALVTVDVDVEGEATGLGRRDLLKQSRLVLLPHVGRVVQIGKLVGEVVNRIGNGVGAIDSAR